MVSSEPLCSVLIGFRFCRKAEGTMKECFGAPDF